MRDRRLKAQRSLRPGLSLLRFLNQLDQSGHLCLGGAVETTVPFAFGEVLSQVDLNREVELPAYDNAGAREIASLLPAIGEGDLPP